MGTVHRALDPHLDRAVAIKLIHPHRLDSLRAKERFVSEAKILARLANPHVVQVFDCDISDDRPYLVLELVTGRSLRLVIDHEGPQPLSKVVDCAWQMLVGLSAAHSIGIIHRDIKPGNILLGSNGVYKLADFGLAHQTDVNLTDPGETLGTMRWLPPEVCMGQPWTSAGDIYALGLTLYEMACGRHPVPGDLPTHAMTMFIAQQVIPPLERELPLLPDDLRQWFSRCLAHQPHQRFADAGQALAALRLVAPPPAGPVHVAPNERRSEEPPTVVQRQQSSRTSAAVLSGTHRPPPIDALPPAPPKIEIRTRLPFALKLTLAIWLMSSAASFFAAWSITTAAVNTQLEQLRKSLCASAASAALYIDGDEHARLAAMGERAKDDPGIAHLCRELEAFKKVHVEVINIYTMVPTSTPGVMAFVVDGSDETDNDHNGVIDANEARAKPGDPYPANAPSLLSGLVQPSADETYTKDAWGTWLCGYAPIRSKSGTVAGLVGLDVSAASIEALKNGFWRQSLILFISTLAAFLAAGWLVALRLRRPVQELARGMLAVAGGNLDAQVTIRSQDEFQLLGEAFEHMRRQLKDAALVRGAYERFVASALVERLAVTHPGAGTHQAHLAIDLSQLGSTAAEHMSNLLSGVLAHAGTVERLSGTVITATFPATHPDDHPEERAVRCALALLASRGLAQHLRCGVAKLEATIASEEAAQALARVNVEFGTDLLVSDSAFADLRATFYADRMDIPGQSPVWAIKGAVSAGR